MKLDSKLFDGIRIRSRREETVPEGPACDWEGCAEPGVYKAPKGNKAEGQYHNFCLQHVRHYNTAFNFFEGMKADDVEAHISRTQKPEASFGTGSKAAPRGARVHARGTRFHDPLHVFARYARTQAKGPVAERAKPVSEQDRRAFETLGLEARAPSDAIKGAYKALVKLHHPDANGGDRSYEDRLRAIISAYTQLK
jgi:hypothetical protein